MAVKDSVCTLGIIEHVAVHIDHGLRTAQAHNSLLCWATMTATPLALRLVSAATPVTRRDTSCFSSEDASGSTSQAASVQELLEVGASCLLMDEDTCATNFMMRDVRMAALVSADKEPITPFVQQIRCVVLSAPADKEASSIPLHILHSCRGMRGMHVTGGLPCRYCPGLQLRHLRQTQGCVGKLPCLNDRRKLPRGTSGHTRLQPWKLEPVCVLPTGSNDRIGRFVTHAKSGT